MFSDAFYDFFPGCCKGAFFWSWLQEGTSVQPHLVILLCLTGTSPFPPQSAAGPGIRNLDGQGSSALRKMHGPGEAENVNGFLSVKIKLNFFLQKVMILSGGLGSVRLIDLIIYFFKLKRFCGSI